MKHYSNHHSSSRSYYKELQKKNNKNLNSSTEKSNTIEEYLENFLSMTYKYLSPIFEDDDEIDSYKNEKTKKYNDNKCKPPINNRTQSSVKTLITFFIKLFKKNNLKLNKTKSHNAVNHIGNSTNRNNARKHNLTNNFVLNKSSV